MIATILRLNIVWHFVRLVLPNSFQQWNNYNIEQWKNIFGRHSSNDPSAIRWARVQIPSTTSTFVSSTYILNYGVKRTTIIKKRPALDQRYFKNIVKRLKNAKLVVEKEVAATSKRTNENIFQMFTQVFFFFVYFFVFSSMR